jgi:predicted outer membrane repeat protein
MLHQGYRLIVRAGFGTAAITALFAAGAASATVLHVDDDAAPGGDGLTWQTAFNDLTDALFAAGPPVTEIWVAAGVYTPTYEFSSGDPRSVAFWLQNNLAFLGGFAGDESSADERDPLVNLTVLSGELGDPGDPTDNCWHILYAISSINDTAVLDGFTIRDGYATFGSERGGAAFLQGADALFANCRFIDNYAIDDGGAVHSSGSPTFVDCAFIGNESGGQGSGGGALYCSSGPTLLGCTFENNVSGRSGGALLVQNATIADCSFDGNIADSSGGAVMGTGNSLNVTNCVFTDNQTVFNHGGAMSNGASNVTLINCTFIDNASPTRGGAIDNRAVEGSTTLIGCWFLGNTANEGGGLLDWSDTLDLINCTFSGNIAAAYGGAVNCSNSLRTTIINSTFASNEADTCGGMYTTSPTTTASNDIFWANSDGGGFDESAQLDSTGAVALNYSLLQGLTGGFGGVGNVDEDPLFVDADGPDLTPGTADDDLRLLPGSPCIDAADNAAVPPDEFDLDDDLDTVEPVPIDGYGGERFFDDPDTTDSGNGEAPIVDMGAYEHDGTTGEPTPGPGEYVGPPGGSWFVPDNWYGGEVPGVDTDVLITTTVVIDQPGAVANLVHIDSGGTLIVTTGSLTTPEILVVPGGLLLLDHVAAQIDVGVLTVQSGGAVQWNAGTVHVTASWVDPGGIMFGCSGDGTLIIDAGATIDTIDVTICAAGTLRGAGTVIADVSNDGLVEPGGSTGSLTIDGDYTQSATGTLSIELDGYVPGAFDQLLVTGNAGLDGALEVVLLGGFVPQLAGDQRIIVAPSILGNFATESIPALPGSFLLALNYDVPTDDFVNRTVQLLTTLSATGPRLYVSQSAAAGGDGQSWLTAADDLQPALDLAALFAGDVDEIWVAAGTYRPDRGTGDRFAEFELSINGTAVYGGFAGDESDLAERDVEANVTIMSGDLAGNDGADFANNDENSYHVVTVIPSGACDLPLEGICVDGLTEEECGQLPDPVVWLGYGTTCATGEVEPITLDGFTISGGNADKPDDTEHRRGGGIDNSQDLVDLSVANCRFTGNHADLRGGGMFDSALQTTVNGCRFTGNRTQGSDGGGYALMGGGAAPQLTDCVFELNDSGRGAGAHVTDTVTPVFTRCTFTTNSGGEGCGLYVEESGFPDVTLVDCEFLSNVAIASAGALKLEDDCTVSATGCTFSNNSPGAIRNLGGTLALADCVFDGNTGDGAVVSYGAEGVLNLTATNTTFTGNASGSTGGGVHLDSGDAALTDCTFANNSAVTEGGGLYIQSQSTVTLDGGSFDGNSASSGSGIYNRFGQLNGTTSLLGGDELFNGATLDPGMPGPPPVAGTISVEGTFRQGHPPGTLAVPKLHIDLGGTLPGDDYDLIDAAAGQAVLGGGTLVVELFNSFEPQIGQLFNIVSTPSVAGVFHVALMPGVPPGLFLNVIYDANGVSVAVEELELTLAFEDVQLSGLGGTPTDAALADMDNDDDLDLILTVRNDPDPGHVAVLLNAGVDPQGNWLGFPDPALTTGVGYAPVSLAVGLFNGDMYPDIAAGNLGQGQLSILFNDADGTGSLTLDQHLQMEGSVRSVAAGTTPGDTSVNLACATASDNEVWHLVNDGSGTFTFEQELRTYSTVPVAVRLADVDQDGDDDLICVRQRTFPEPSALTIWLYDDLTGLFGDAMYFDIEPGSATLQVADMNGDTFADLIVTSPMPGKMSILVNQADGNGVFAPPIPILLGNELHALAVSDLELDGDGDLVAAVHDEQDVPATRVVRNDQNEGNQLTLATAIDLATGGDPVLIVTGDVDGDDVPDLVAVNEPSAAAGGSASVGVLLNSTLVQPCPCDCALPSDGTVNVVDFLALLGQWGGTGPCDCADGGDGVVNVVDFLAMLGAWGSCS